MSMYVSLSLAVLAGSVLGAFFFGGLWWTIRRGLSSTRPVSWFFGSLLLRTGMVLIGFYYLLGDDWRRLLAGLLGFVIGRLIVTRLTRPPCSRVAEASHAH